MAAPAQLPERASLARPGRLDISSEYGAESMHHRIFVPPLARSLRAALRSTSYRFHFAGQFNAVNKDHPRIRRKVPMHLLSLSVVAFCALATTALLGSEPSSAPPVSPKTNSPPSSKDRAIISDTNSGIQGAVLFPPGQRNPKR